MKRFKTILLILGFIFLSLTVKSAIAYYGGGDINKIEDDIFGKRTEYNAPSFNKETFKNLQASVVIDIFGATQPKYRTMTGGGAIAGVSHFIAQLYSNPPASSLEYFADLGRNLGIVKPAYAQGGTGFNSFINLLPLWKATRNLAYIFFVIAFLATGVAIMFRVKLDPKTIITIQNSIPKLVVALILVTFSYAIAGLMIDLIYLMIYVGVLAFKEPLTAAGKTLIVEQEYYANLNYWNMVVKAFGSLGQGIGANPLAGGIGGFLGSALSGAGYALITGTGFLSSLLPGVLIFAAIIGIIFLFLIFKLLLALLGCYIAIIISVITAPLQILFGVLPGNQGGFSAWFRNLFANILVFPAVALLVLLSWLLLGSYGPSWSPPGIGMSGEGLTPLLALGMLLLMNKVPEMVKTAFKMKPAGYGAAIGQAFGPGKTAGTYAVGELVGRGGSMEAWDRGIPGAWTARAQTLRKMLGFK